MTWPQVNNMGGFSFQLVTISLETGQMKTLWNLKSLPRSISIGSSLEVLIISDPLDISYLTFESFGNAYALASVIN